MPQFYVVCPAHPLNLIVVPYSVVSSGGCVHRIAEVKMADASYTKYHRYKLCTGKGSERFPLQWRHMSIMRCQFCGNSTFFSRVCFGVTSKTTSKPTLLVLCEGNSRLTGGFPHKGPVTRKAFPRYDVIMFPGALPPWDLCCSYQFHMYRRVKKSISDLDARSLNWLYGV